MSFVSRIWKCCSPQWCKVGFGSVRFKMSFVPKSGNAAVHDVAPLALKLNDNCNLVRRMPNGYL